MKIITLRTIALVSILFSSSCCAYSSKNKPVQYKDGQDIKGRQGFAYFTKDIRVIHFPCDDTYDGKKTIDTNGSLKRVDMTAQEAQEKYRELAAQYDKQGKRRRECLL